jgi:hypothetical protein
MKPRVNSNYVYVPVGMDVWDARTSLKLGDEVKVIKSPHGCPPSGTMGHTYVGDPVTGHFIGLVLCNSLVSVKEYKESK